MIDSLYLIKEVRVMGNRVTKMPIIEREIVLQEGHWLTAQELAEKTEITRSNLINTNLFLEVEVVTSSDSLGELSVSISVRERWYLSILPYVVLSDRSFNEWWYERNRDLRRLTYGVNFTKYNFSGNADILQAGVYMGFAPHYQLSYNRPYVDRKKRIGMAGRVFYSSRRNLPYQTWNDKLAFLDSDSLSLRRIGGSVDFRYRHGHNIFHIVSVGLSANLISDTLAKANPSYFGNGRTKQLQWSLGYEFRADYRDIRQYALRGYYLSAFVNHFAVHQGRDQTNLTVSFTKYQPLAKRIFWESGLRAKVSFPREQSFFLISGLGYNGNVARGYELYVIDGQYFVLSRNTLKWKAFTHTFNVDWIIKKKEFSTVPIAVYPNIYLDYSFVRNFNPEQSNSKLSNNHLLGVGAGIDVVTFYNVNIRTYYSVNRKNEGKFFLSLGREF